MGDTIILGGGGHAKVLISILKKLNEFTVMGYTDLENRGVILGAKYLGSDEILRALGGASPHVSLVIGVGMVSIPDAKKRKELFELASSLGFELPAIVSPNAIVNEEVTLGFGTVVMDGVVVNSGCVIGDGVILNTSSSVDHDCHIGSFTHIAPNATVSGGSRIGKNVLLGAGATVIQNITISNDVLIGAGASVIDDVSEPGSYVGVPARKFS